MRWASFRIDHAFFRGKRQGDGTPLVGDLLHHQCDVVLLTSLHQYLGQLEAVLRDTASNRLAASW